MLLIYSAIQWCNLRLMTKSRCGLGNPDLYLNKREEILNTPADRYIGYLVEVDLRYCNKIKEKQRVCHFVLKK